MSASQRLHSLDAVRAGALLLGVALHASMSFLPGLPPGIWAMKDVSPSPALGQFFFVTHIFRMSLFFFIAGFFAHLLHQRAGLRGFAANRTKRILVPLVAGWCVVFPAIALVWSWGLSKVFEGAVPPRPPQMPAGFFPLTHLWFLYYLLLLYVVLLALRAVIVAIDRGGGLRALADRTLRGLLSGPQAVLVLPLLLGAPTAWVLYTRPVLVYAAGIPTPDMTLVPQLPAMVAFGTAMAFGWLVHRQAELLDVLRRRWVAHLAVAIVATVVCARIAGAGFQFGVPQPASEKLAFAAAYVVALWSWVLGLTGLGMRFFARESALRRYVADSSYWLYIAHLPVVAAFGVLVGHWPLHWSIKFPLVLAASFTVLFASYHWLVRPTFVGAWLNGRRYSRRGGGPGPALDASGVR